MEKQRPLQAEEMLEEIFYYMNQLVEERDFLPTILLLTNLGRTLVNSERASFWYWDRNKKEYWTLAALDTERIVVPEGSGIVGASIQNNEVIVANKPYEDERFNPQVDKETGYLTKSILCMPVKNTRGQVIGAYQAINKIDEDGESNFNEQDIKNLTLAAAFCGKTLESHLFYTEAHVDPLTKLKNRRGCHEYYTDYVCPNLQEKQISIIMCDIDFFKKVNDTYGHNAGDAVLVEVSKLLFESIGEQGEVIRWGGEEFLILLMECSEEKTKTIAESIRQKAEKMVCTFEGTDIKVTMSFGVAALDKELTMDENIEKADARLYQAKTSGRNRVIAGV